MSAGIRDTDTSRKGRRPIGKGPMSPAERQRRRRKKLAAKALAVMSNSERRKKQAGVYIPMPPGITYWRYVEVRLTDGTIKRIVMPETKPLAACERCLPDDDVIALIKRLGTIARANGIPDAARRALEGGIAARRREGHDC